MPLGPGKYDEAATAARKQTRANGVILIVFDGDRGNGFSAQLDARRLFAIPQMLRNLADEIEKSGPLA
jgi:hypothetical protein